MSRHNIQPHAPSAPGVERDLRAGGRVAASRSTILIRGALVAACLFAGATSVMAEPAGVWIDHTGRGAVEIKPCGGALCGYLVWLQDGKNRSLCGRQIIGNAQPIRSGLWDKGWIYSPEDDRRYDLELKTNGNDKLQITGYMGSKFFSETMTWRRAPADIKRCDAPAAPTPQLAPAVEATNKAGGGEPSGVAEAVPALPATSGKDGTLAEGPSPTTDAPAVAQAQLPPVASAGGVAKSARRPASEDDDDDDAGVTIERKRTSKGQECRVGLGDFKIAFPCPD